MSEFKVGDKVRRKQEAGPWCKVVPGEVRVIRAVHDSGVQLEGCTAYGHAFYSLELVTDEPSSGEKDPNGTDPHSPGAKLDAGKVEFGLILHGMPRALRQVARVATYGANKYTRHGWLAVPDGPRRYTDAMYRHLNAEATGELHDADTQLEHAAHAAWNALARLELLLRGQGI